ncbi:MAG: hypothetical protein A2W91_18300 [Bacteroidetes bacterium GWF2_38_335]|nr:MAG: hypothetical protein A2W91_18300 [Bacteroidetes bacterium GWF2_38_335]OFY80083.1 MAG: hypothetical protein A2281_12335 [Bacteroidetes bacterium RIFOXYA12_FULL_38_20]HBS88592.1 hypothetical protein [Bacteroidales bacterium]
MKTLTVVFTLISLVAFSQPAGKAKEVFDLINMAREKPSDFYTKYKEQIEKYNPKYAERLKKLKPIEKAIWDPGLVEQGRKSVENKDLNPEYKGTNTLCGSASGSSSGTLSDDALSYVCDISNNVHDPNCLYIGLYFNKSLTGYSFNFGFRCDRIKIEYTFNERVDSSGVDFNKLNTAKNATYMSAAEKRMILEINFARAYPKVYSKIIAEYLSQQSAAWGGLSPDEYEAGMEIIAELDTMKPLTILKPSECVYKAAKLHGQDSQKRGYFAHEGSDGSMPWDRILKQCPELKSGNENGAGNSSESARVPVIELLIDDGISSRGHRYNTIDPKWVYCGCYRYEDEKYGYHWVQNYGY